MRINQHDTFIATLYSRTGEIEHLTLLVEKLERMLFITKSEKALRHLEQRSVLSRPRVHGGDNMCMDDPAVSGGLIAGPHRRRSAVEVRRVVEETLEEGASVAHVAVDPGVRAGIVQGHRHVRPKLSCVAYDRMVQAPAPSRLINCGLAGAGLLARVLVSKYAYHQALYWQSEIYARETSTWIAQS